MRSNCRRTRGALRRRKWLFMPLARMILPVAVTLNRRLAPLWVLSFCFATALRVLPFVLALLLLERIQHHRHRAAFETRRLLDRPVRPEHIRELIEQRLPDVGMRHLPSAEQHRHLDLVPGIEELGGLTALRFQIVVVDLRPDANFFQLDHVLVSTRLAFFAALLVPELAVIHDPANRRYGIRRDFDQVESPRPCHLHRVAGGNDPDLLPFLVDEPDFADTNPFVDASLHWSAYGLPPRCNLLCPTIQKKSDAAARSLRASQRQSRRILARGFNHGQSRPATPIPPRHPNQGTLALPVRRGVVERPIRPNPRRSRRRATARRCRRRGLGRRCRRRNRKCASRQVVPRY